jgi:hypothetical protein
VGLYLATDGDRDATTQLLPPPQSLLRVLLQEEREGWPELPVQLLVVRVWGFDAARYVQILSVSLTLFMFVTFVTIYPSQNIKTANI